MLVPMWNQTSGSPNVENTETSSYWYLYAVSVQEILTCRRTTENCSCASTAEHNSKTEETFPVETRTLKSPRDSATQDMELGFMGAQFSDELWVETSANWLLGGTLSLC